MVNEREKRKEFFMNSVIKLSLVSFSTFLLRNLWNLGGKPNSYMWNGCFSFRETRRKKSGTSVGGGVVEGVRLMVVVVGLCRCWCSDGESRVRSVCPRRM